jgi:hypothetical protein
MPSNRNHTKLEWWMIPAYVALSAMLGFVVYRLLFPAPPHIIESRVGPAAVEQETSGTEVTPVQGPPYDWMTMRPRVDPPRLPRPKATPVPAPTPPMVLPFGPVTHQPTPKPHR